MLEIKVFAHSAIYSSYFVWSNYVERCLPFPLSPNNPWIRQAHLKSDPRQAASCRGLHCHQVAGPVAPGLQGNGTMDPGGMWLPNIHRNLSLE